MSNAALLQTCLSIHNDSAQAGHQPPAAAVRHANQNYNKASVNTTQQQSC